jgi:hypothetical protein
MLKAREILEAARENISDEKDWCKKAYISPSGKVCATGALYSAYVNANELNPKALDEALHRLGLIVGGSIEAYNDRSDTTHKCVLAAFDAAIEACE